MLTNAPGAASPGGAKGIPVVKILFFLLLGMCLFIAGFIMEDMFQFRPISRTTYVQQGSLTMGGVSGSTSTSCPSDCDCSSKTEETQGGVATGDPPASDNDKASGTSSPNSNSDDTSSSSSSTEVVVAEPPRSTDHDDHDNQVIGPNVVTPGHAHQEGKFKRAHAALTAIAPAEVEEMMGYLADFKKKNIQVVYPLDYGGWQLVEYALALYEWTGGIIALPSDQKILSGVEKHLKKHKVNVVRYPLRSIMGKYSDSSKYYVFLTCWGFGKGALHTTSTAHGNSEKWWYKTGYKHKSGGGVKPFVKSWQVLGPLILSRFLRGTLEITAEGIIEQFGLDPKKKTILYLSTHSDTSLAKTAGLDIFKALGDLSSKYNVLAKFHPLSYQRIWEPNQTVAKLVASYFGKARRQEGEMRKQLEKIKTIPESMYNFMPFAQLADVIIGDISGSTCMCTFFHKTPLIYGRRKEFANREKSGLTLTSKEAHIIDENGAKQLKEMVEKLLVSGDTKEMQQAKLTYYHRWNGPLVDEYVGLRHALYMIHTVNRQIQTRKKEDTFIEYDQGKKVRWDPVITWKP